jgi:hypothetical protein
MSAAATADDGLRAVRVNIFVSCPRPVRADARLVRFALGGTGEGKPHEQGQAHEQEVYQAAALCLSKARFR